MLTKTLAVAAAATFVSTAAPALTVTQSFDIVVTTNNVLDGSSDPNAYIGSTGSGMITYEMGNAFEFFTATDFSFFLNLDGFSQTFTNSDSPFGGASGFLDASGSGVADIYFDVLDDDFVNGRLDIINAPNIVDFSTIGLSPDIIDNPIRVKVEVQTAGDVTPVALPASLPLGLLAFGALGLLHRKHRRA